MNHDLDIHEFVYEFFYVEKNGQRLKWIYGGDDLLVGDDEFKVYIAFNNDEESEWCITSDTNENLRYDWTKEFSSFYEAIVTALLHVSSDPKYKCSMKIKPIHKRYLDQLSKI